jgi:peptidoglycan-associated lipoprotein
MTIKGWKTSLLATFVLISACQRSTEALPPMPPMPPARVNADNATDKATQIETDVLDRDGDSTATLPGSVEDFIEQSGSDRVLFAYDSQELDETAKAILRRQAAWLLRYTRVEAVIEGHTDENGTREYNYALGARRAANIRVFLVGQGVDPSRLSLISFGKDRPAAETSDEAGLALSRRGITALTNAATR